MEKYIWGFRKYDLEDYPVPKLLQLRGEINHDVFVVIFAIFLGRKSRDGKQTEANTIMDGRRVINAVHIFINSTSVVCFPTRLFLQSQFPRTTFAANFGRDNRTVAKKDSDRVLNEID